MHEVRVASLFSNYVSRYSLVQSFTTPEVIVNACGAAPPPPITASTVPLTTALAGQYWQVGDFEMQVREVRGGDGIFTGWGVMSVPYLGLQIPVKFEGVWVDEDYSLVKGEVVALSEGLEGFQERWQDGHPPQEEEAKSDSPVVEGQQQDAENGQGDKVEVSSVTVAGEVVGVYINEQGQVVAVDSQGNEEVVAEQVPQEGEVLAVQDSQGNRFTVDSGGGVSGGEGGNNSASDSSAPLAAHALEQRLLAELLQDFDQKIAVWLENHEKGPLDEELLRKLQELPSCLPPGSEELIGIHQFIEQLQADLEETWNSLSEASQQWFSEVVETLSPEDASLAEQLSEEEAQTAEEIVCELLTGNDSTFVLQLFEGLEEREAESFLYISGTSPPVMPDVRIKVSGGAETYEVKLVIEDIVYKKTGSVWNLCRDDETSFPSGGDWQEIDDEETWDVNFGTSFRGGKACVIARSGEVADTLIFHIRGQNPEVGLIQAYQATIPDGNTWYFPRMLRQESSFRQFNNGTSGTNNGAPVTEETRAIDNGGRPNWGPPYGWGLKQLDNLGDTYGYQTGFNGRYGPFPDELWNWQANQRKGVEFFNGEKLGAAQNAWDRALLNLATWEELNWNIAQDNYPMEIVESLNAAEVGTIIEDEMVIGTVTYSSHHRNLPAGNVNLLIADALKRYNGGSYYSLFVPAQAQDDARNPNEEPQLPTWQIDKTQRRRNQQADYVQEISTTTGW